jgi:trehalose-phosphatase
MARHSHRLLMLDFDGTLAPIVPERMQARLSDAAFAALKKLANRPGERVAVISGRPLSELRTLLPDLPIHLVGEHGWEDRSPNGLTCTHEPGTAARWRLQLAHRIAHWAGCGPRVERKRASVVLHVRGIADEAERRQADRVARLWRLLAAGRAFSLDETNGGHELRATARGKHTAVLGLLRGMPPGTLPVFLGDDVSDEDAFRVLRPLGITIRVGTVARPTSAEWSLASPGEVAEFLARWAALSAEAR